METLTEEDLEWLTKAENPLIRMRKREAENANRICPADAIKTIDWLRELLKGRFSKA
jgi:hypothetical protein